MSAALRPLDPPPVQKLRGVLLSISRQAQRDLERLSSESLHFHIHRLRVRMKKLRAVLRLLDSGLSTSMGRVIKGRWRVLKRAFAAQRDEHVLQSLLSGLEAKRAASQPRLAPGSRQKPKSLPSQAALRRLKTAARALTQCLERMKVRPLDWDDIAGAYTRRYARARRSFRRCRHEPSASRLHRWRSPVKDHYFQSLLMLRDRRHLKVARRLGSLLGEMHDLAMLRRHCRHSAPHRVRHGIGRQMHHLRARIFRKARRLFRNPPAKLLRQVRVAG